MTRESVQPLTSEKEIENDKRKWKNIPPEKVKNLSLEKVKVKMTREVKSENDQIKVTRQEDNKKMGIASFWNVLESNILFTYNQI